jgi:hypothetical protein
MEAAMTMRVPFLSAVLTLLTMPSARADYYVPLADGTYLQLSDPLLFFGAVVVFAVLFTAITKTSSKSAADDLPKELQSTETAEQYEQEARRARALARKLDAETELKESQIRAAIKSDELKEIEELLRNGKSRRGR